MELGQTICNKGFPLKEEEKNGGVGNDSNDNDCEGVYLASHPAILNSIFFVTHRTPGRKWNALAFPSLTYHLSIVLFIYIFYLRQNKNCLTNAATNTNQEEIDGHLERLPGQIFSPDDQCRYIHGPNSYYCGVRRVH